MIIELIFDVILVALLDAKPGESAGDTIIRILLTLTVTLAIVFVLLLIALNWLEANWVM